MLEALKIFANYGLPGIVVLGMALWVYFQDRHHRTERRAFANERKSHAEALQKVYDEMREEQRLRVEDAKAYAALALGLQKETLTATGSIAAMIQESSKMQTALERVSVALERAGRIRS